MRVVPVFGLGPPLHIVLTPLALPLLSSRPPILLSTACVLCHSIVGLVLCFCDRVVSLWNSGDGLCWVEGCVVCGVRCQLLLCCVYCLVVLCCGLWVVEWRWGVCGLVACLLLSLCVGVRGSARAAMRARTLSPNTIASPLLFALSSLLFSSSLLAFLRSSPFFVPRLSCYCGMAVCDSPCVGVLCWHDCDG